MLTTQQRDRIVTVAAYVAGTCVVAGMFGVAAGFEQGTWLIAGGMAVFQLCLFGAMALTPESGDEEEQP